MRLALILAILVAPSAVSADEIAAACASLVQSLYDISTRVDDALSIEVRYHDQMLDMRERIGGQDGAALEARATRHLDEIAEQLVPIRRLVEEANDLVLSVCRQE